MQTRQNKTYSLDNYGLDTLLLTRLLHFLRRLQPIEIVDCNVASLFRKREGYHLTEATVWDVNSIQFNSY